jgi:thioesterase domain-containing protein
MASQLQRTGESVELVALLDAATPQALRKRGRVTKERLGRVRQALAQARKDGRGPLQRTRLVFNAISRKLISVVVWEIAQRSKRWAVKARFRLLRIVLARNLAWPEFVPELSVRQIYESAEARYVPKPLSNAFIVLVRARARLGEEDDTPYLHIYADETFGWGSFAHDLAVINVDGGHSSMLQEPFVESLAKALRPYVGAKRAAPIRARAIEATVL